MGQRIVPSVKEFFVVRKRLNEIYDRKSVVH